MINKKVLYVVRGLPGGGNWNLAFEIAAKHPRAQVVGDGVALTAAIIQSPVVVLVGTFAQLHEMRDARAFAGQFGYDLVVLEATGPLARDPDVLAENFPHLADKIRRAAERWEHLRL